MAAISGFGQELPKEPIGKHIHDGVIYWHKDMPYYMFIGSDSTGEDILMHSRHQAKYSNPSYFDTYGWNFIRTKWAVDKITHEKVVPEQEIMWEVFVDGDAPVTTPVFTSKSAYLVNGVRYFTNDLIMELSAKELNPALSSGIRSIYYSINNAAYIKYEKALKLNPKDTFDVKYFAVDNVGNFEKPVKFAYKADDYSIKYAVDSYAPETDLVATFMIKDNVAFAGPNTGFSFKSRDKGAGVAFTNYYFDSPDSLKTYGGKPFTLAEAGLKKGWHEIHFFSVDWVTNKEIVQTKGFYVEDNIPLVYISAKGSYFSKDSIMFVNDTTSIRVLATGNVGIKRIAYKFTDDKTYQVYTGPVRLPQNYKPRQDLKYFATDSVDNESAVYVLKLERDKYQPNVHFMIIGPQFVRNDTTYVTDKTAFGTFNYDTLSGVGRDRLCVNGERSKQVSFVKPGIYVVIDSVWDNVGNLKVLEKTFHSDSSVPEITFTFSNPVTIDDTYPSGMILFIAIEDETGIKSYRTTVNGKDFLGTNFQGKPGNYRVETTAIDFLNQAAIKSVEFQIK